MSDRSSGEGPERWADDQHRYRLESRIATGGMGEVWRATDTSLNRQVAVKVLKSEYADDPRFRQRFETEARHAAALQHPGVASVFDVGESHTLGAGSGAAVAHPYLVMELVEGQPLSALLRGGRRLDPEVVRDLMTQAAEAIGVAHRAGIVHRDVKPANLIVTPDRTVKITDFGIARAADGLGLTGTGQVLGTPQYLSPEQARGGTATPASDVYALGVVAFECLAGHRPFEADSPVATAIAHLNEPVPDLPPSVPADLAAVVRRALAKAPGDRYVDGAAIAAALRDPAAAPAPMVEPATQVLGVPTATADVPLDPTPTVVPGPPPGPPPDRRSPWPVVLLVLALVAAVVVIVLLATRPDGDTDPGGTTPSETPSSTAPTEETSSAATESAPTPITLVESQYVGRDLDEVLDDLRQLGLKPDAVQVDNPGDQEAETVRSVSPTSGLSEGDIVTVEFYRDAEPTPEPSPSETTPSPSASASPPASQSPSESASASETPSASTTDGGAA